MGRWHTLILDENGDIWSCGWGRFGVLGLGDTRNHSEFQYVAIGNGVDSNETVIDIQCGAVHNCCTVRDENGNRIKKKIYVWGRGKFGRLGTGNERNVLRPTLLRMDWLQRGDSVEQMALGGDDGILVTKRGMVYVWGKSEEGQLGVDYGGKSVLKPTQLRLPRNVMLDYKVDQVVMGDCHSMILMKQRNKDQNRKHSGYRRKRRTRYRRK